MQKPAGLDCCFAEYLLNLQDDIIHSFITDHRIKAAGVKTNCNIELTKRILNRKVNGFKWVKYSILRITGPDELSIGQCNKLIERVYPPYKYRKEYFRRAPVVLYTGDVMPDNTALYYTRQRTGRTAPVCGEMRVESPYEIGRSRNPDNVPWKGSKIEEAGVYYPSAYGNENLFKFYNLGKINSKPMHYNKEGVFDPQLVGPFAKRGITPSCNRDYQASGISKHLKNMAFGKIGQMPAPDTDSERPESRGQQLAPTGGSTYGESMQGMDPNFGPESPQAHYSDISQNSNQSASSGQEEMREETFQQSFQPVNSFNLLDIDDQNREQDAGGLILERGSGSHGKGFASHPSESQASERVLTGDKYASPVSQQGSPEMSASEQVSQLYSADRSASQVLSRERSASKIDKSLSQGFGREKTVSSVLVKTASQVLAQERNDTISDNLAKQAIEERYSTGDHLIMTEPPIKSKTNSLKQTQSDQQSRHSERSERKSQAALCETQSARSSRRSDRSRSEAQDISKQSRQIVNKADLSASSRQMTAEDQISARDQRTLGKQTSRTSTSPKPLVQEINISQQNPLYPQAPVYNTTPPAAYYNPYKPQQVMATQREKVVVPVVRVGEFSDSTPRSQAEITNVLRQEGYQDVIGSVPNGYYGDMIIKDKLPLGHNDPVIIMVDGQDIIMTGNTAMSMTGNEHGKFVMNLGTEDYNISISGDRERLRYMKGGTRTQNQNVKSNLSESLKPKFQPGLNHVQVIV